MKTQQESSIFSISSLRRFFSQPEGFLPLAIFLWFAEVVLNYVIINYIPYTEIDWIAYMDEVRGVIEGQFDYKELRGPTGPLVYPAGFVYIYGLLYFLTDNGTNIGRAQYIFMGIYLIFLAIVFYVYKLAESPPWTLLLVCASRRIHSIFVLRLFNDPIAMLFLYLSIVYFSKQKWSTGCFWFSVAVSVKMNILLFAPSLLVLLLKTFGIRDTIPKLFICASVQVVLALPFLVTYPWSYVACAFNFGREFFYIWSVNWKFVPESIFLSKPFAISLLVIHLSLLLAFFFVKWCHYDKGGWANVLFTWKRSPPQQLTPEHITTLMFTGNFIGIVLSRSLHYQFYSWYYHALPYLLTRTNFTNFVCIPLLIAIEIAWNIFPSNAGSSLLLFSCHLILLAGLWFTPSDYPYQQKETTKDE